MLKRVRTVGVAVVAVLVAGVGGAAAVTSPVEHVPQPRAKVVVKRGVAVAPSTKQVNEGDRFAVTATIRSPRKASRITLQKWRPSLYGWDSPRWERVKTARVAGRKRVSFRLVATGLNNERFRATVSYKKAKTVTSKPIGVTVWRWIPLSQYRPYYQSEPYAMTFGTTTINGRSYSGWGAASSSHTGAWEARFTPGRHCKAFRAVIGLGDVSADGSTGTIAFTGDDGTLYASPGLRPGMQVPVMIRLALPYRFGIRLLDTTPGGTSGRDAVEAWPVIGEPALLCTAV